MSKEIAMRTIGLVLAMFLMGATVKVADIVWTGAVESSTGTGVMPVFEFK